MSADRSQGEANRAGSGDAQQLRFLRAALASVADGVVIVDAEGRMLFMNEAGRRLAQRLPAPEVPVETQAEAFRLRYPDGRAVPPEETPLGRALRGETVQDFLLILVRPDGTDVYINNTASPVRDEGGNVVGAVSVFRDVTARARAEEEYKTVLRSAIDGFWIMDVQGRILDVNEAFCRMTGYSRDELLKMRIQEVEAAETPEETARHIRRVMETGSDRFETRHRRKDGAVIDVEVSVNYLAGDPGRFFAFLRDITERNQVERALRESEERLCLVAMHSPDIIFCQDRELRYTWIVNPATPLVEQQVLGKTDADLLPPDEARLLTEIKGKVLETGAGARLEIRLSPGGIPRYYDVAYEPWRAADGRVLGIISYARDITDRKRAEEERERLLAKLQEVAAGAQQRASELDAIIESMVDAVYVAEPRGVLTRVNRAAVELLGLKTREEALRPLAEYPRLVVFRYPDGRVIPPEEYGLARALRGESFTGFVFQSETPEGRSYWASVSGAPVRDEQGRIVAAVNVTRDITVQVEAERERERLLQEVEVQRRFLQAVVAHAPAGIAVLRGPDFAHELVNPALQAMVPGKPMMGRTVGEVFPEFSPQVLPILQQVVRTGEPFSVVDMPIPIRRAPEATLEERYFSFSYIPLRSPEGGVDAVLLLAIETTEQVHARKKLEDLAQLSQRRAAELESVLDNMVDGVFVVDLQGRVTLANEAGVRLLGMGRVEEMKLALAEFPEKLRIRHPDGNPIAPEELPLSRALKGEVVTLEHEVVYSPRTQRDVYLRTNASPLRDESGKIVGAVEVARDVTEVVELERLKDQFISVAAHELKTPVAIMKGYAQLLLRRAGGVLPEQRKMLEAIDRGSSRIDGIVQDLLDVSRLHLGYLAMAAERIDLPELVEEVVDRMALTTTKHRLRLVKAEPVVVQGDRYRLEQVLVNLIDNAIRYSPKGGDVDLEVAVKDGEAVVTVRDQGVGIPKEKQDRIFQRFYRAHTGTPYDYGGMGVGLYISREIVSRHGGRMGFESEEGKGSVFYFSLPLRGKHAGR